MFTQTLTLTHSHFQPPLLIHRVSVFSLMSAVKKNNKKSEESDNWNMFNNSDEHSQVEIPLIKYSYHTDTQSLDTVCVYACVCAHTCSWTLWFSVCCNSVQPESWWPGWFYPIPSHPPRCPLPADSGVPTSTAHPSAGTWKGHWHECKHLKHMVVTATMDNPHKHT